MPLKPSSGCHLHQHCGATGREPCSSFGNFGWPENGSLPIHRGARMAAARHSLDTAVRISLRHGRVLASNVPGAYALLRTG